MATQENPSAAVDETPISPVAAGRGRKMSLEQHLKQRPDRSELVDKNILPDSTAAPGLQEKQKEVCSPPISLSYLLPYLFICLSVNSTLRRGGTKLHLIACEAHACRLPQ